MAGLVLASAGVFVGQTEPSGTPVSEEQARQALRDTFGNYRLLKSYSVEMNSSAEVKVDGAANPMFDGIAESMKQTSVIRYARPDRMYMKSDNAVAVRSGDKIAIGFPMMLQYIEEEADESAIEMLNMMAGGGGTGELSPIGMIISDEEAIDEFIDGLKDIKAETVATEDGERLHVSATMPADSIPVDADIKGFAVDLWIDVKEKVFTKHKLNLTEYMNAMMKEMAEAQENSMLPTTVYSQFAMITEFESQRLNPEFSDADFAYDWEKAGYTKGDPADFGGMFGMEESALVGLDAPAIESETIDGEAFQLSDLRGNVVVLDFWATWCGPCVQAIPKIQKLHEQFEGKPVRIVGINQDRGGYEKVKAFLEKEEITFTQVKDASNVIGMAYEVQGIPTTVLIDQQGVIQTYDVGFLPGHEKTMAEHIEKLLNGESIVTDQQREENKAKRDAMDDDSDESLPQSKKTEEDAEGKTSMRLEEKVSFHGSWWAVMSDDSNSTIIAAKSDGRCVVFDSEGNQIHKFELRRNADIFRPANIIGDAAAEILNFGVWNQELTVHDQTGKILWSYPIDYGINDVWPGDLDGDGYDEVVVGYNGAGGLHVLDRNGKLLWKNKSIANCWHVGVGDIAPEDKGVEVFSTSAGGTIHVFDAKGNVLKTFQPGQYCDVVRAMHDGSIFTGLRGIDDPAVTLVNYDGDPQSKRVALTGSTHLNDALPAPNKPWVAVSARNESVYVIDVEAGVLLSKLEHQGDQAHVAWLSRSESDPWLLVANGASMNAYALVLAD